MGDHKQPGRHNAGTAATTNSERLRQRTAAPTNAGEDGWQRRTPGMTTGGRGTTNTGDDEHRGRRTPGTTNTGDDEHRGRRTPGTTNTGDDERQGRRTPGTTIHECRTPTLAFVARRWGRFFFLFHFRFSFSFSFSFSYTTAASNCSQRVNVISFI
jgi:hypothetical protein